MALTLLFNTLDVDLAARRATGRFHFDAVADLPSRGDAAAWVQTPGGTAFAGGWRVASVRANPSVINIATIEARVPGFNWTWCDASGNPLAPVASRDTYRLWTTNKTVDGVLLLGYWHLFSNWTDSDGFTFGSPDPITDKLRTWTIEFVSSTQYSGWIRHKNGTWPTGLVPPAGTGAGIYWCRSLDVEEEPWGNPDDATPSTFYRHFATFWEAPSLGATQLTWVFDSW